MASYASLAAEKAGLGIGGGASDVMTDAQADIQFAEAYKDVVNKVAQSDPSLLDLFAVKINSGWSNNTYKLQNNYVLGVWRKGSVAPANVFRQCRKISNDLKYLAVPGSGSIHECSEMDPVFYYENRQLTVLPDHTVNSGEFEFMGVICPDTIDGDDTFPNQPIDDGEIIMPQDHCIFLVLYVAIKLVEKKLSLMNDGLNTMIDEDNASAAPSGSQGGWEVVRYYIQDEEDPELSAAKIQELSAEQQQWAQEYQWYQERLQRLKSEYLEPFAGLVASAGAGQNPEGAG